MEDEDGEVFPSADGKGWLWDSIFDRREPIGHHMSFHANGMLHRTRNYNIISRPIKSCVDYQENGIYKYRRPHDAHGHRAGLWISYSESGGIKVCGRYRKSVKEGTWYNFRRVLDRFHLLDPLYVNDVVHYRNGRLHGLCGIYSVDWSTIYHESVYANGKYVRPHGTRTARWTAQDYEFYDNILRGVSYDSHIMLTLFT